MIRNSFEGKESIDLASVIAEFPHNDENPHRIPVKKLSQVFDSCAKMDGEDCMKVYLRVRPIQNLTESTIIVESENTIVTNAPESSKRALYTKTEARHYMFTRIFDIHSQQNEVFEHCAAPMLRRFIDGENTVIFAYGMTNAGKTYTIQGTSASPGILPRLVSAILDHKFNRTNLELHISALEVYQENIYDLLGKRREKLQIRDGSGKVEVSKLSYHSITSTQDAFKLMDIASSKRSKSSTFLNTGSSRSHAVYSLTLSRPSADGKEMHSVAFQLVDLAGAERGSRTKATSAQQKEANNINTSLMQLWRCLQAVKRKNAELNSSMEVIPFRESKLTHLLMPILSRAGLGGVAMIACVNPQGDDYDETLSILGNASIASKIREFADVGRVASQTVPSSVVEKVVPAPTTTANTTVKTIRLEELKDYKDKHQKESDNQSVASSTIGSKRRRADSTLGSKGLSATAGGKKVSSAYSKPAIDKDQPAPTTVTTGYEDDENLSERKKLRREIEELKQTNNELLIQNIQKETEIREEISKEMMSRSTGLLNKISDLQNQLSLYETQSINDIMTRSVKKAKQSKLCFENEDLVEQLQETEEEMERMKVEYEYEINKLKYENLRLKEEMNKLKTNGISGGAAINGGKKRKNSKQKSDENQENEVKKSPIHSPNRSPLSQISTNSPKLNSVNPNNSENNRKASPLKLNSMNTDIENIQVKVVSSNLIKQSPQRIRTGGMNENINKPAVNNNSSNANNSGTYFTRLRSQLIRL